MRTLIFGMLAAIVVAVGAGFIFRAAREPVHTVYSAPSVRLGDPGTNLVGPRWTGEPQVSAADRQASTGSRSGTTE